MALLMVKLSSNWIHCSLAARGKARKGAAKFARAHAWTFSFVRGDLVSLKSVIVAIDWRGVTRCCARVQWGAP
jgi:hypothetical protein